MKKILVFLYFTAVTLFAREAFAADYWVGSNAACTSSTTDIIEAGKCDLVNKYKQPAVKFINCKIGTVTETTANGTCYFTGNGATFMFYARKVASCAENQDYINGQCVDKCKAGETTQLNNFGVKWSNSKSGMIVPMLPPSPSCDGKCRVTISYANNFRFKDTPLEKNDWKLLADDLTLTKTGQTCTGSFPVDPPPPESPPGMNCGYYNGHQVCMGKDKTYVCKKMASGQTACLPTQDLEKGQVCGDVDGKYVCMDLNDPKADICEKQGDGSMKCLPKENLYENNTGSDSGKTDGDDAGTTESDKDTAVTPGTSAPDANKGWGEKYDKGLGGIWMVKTKEMQNTDIVRFAKKIMPTDMNAGVRPSWTIEFEAPVIGYVSHDIDVPGEVWAGLKMIVLAMASIFAFRLIFGGA